MGKEKLGELEISGPLLKQAVGSEGAFVRAVRYELGRNFGFPPDDVTRLPTRQRQLFDILADYSEPQPTPVLARIAGYKHGVNRSVVYDTLGALEGKGFVRLTSRGWEVVDRGGVA